MASPACTSPPLITIAITVRVEAPTPFARIGARGTELAACLMFAFPVSVQVSAQ